MNREEAIKGLKVLRKDFSGYKPNEEMFDMAIEALQTPPISQRSMYQTGYRQGKEDALQNMKEGSIDGCNNKK